ncbi:MAG: adenylyltransferase/cytidyltransferase family protein [candidate division KSB1 bacterium]|nr:adenylyltransferase/cytidyltransferase family protein [candidate division KSB1 bacterium]MDZ7319184.1 adenylyltransferase/cytidyltransferase family protein [candidate division KSB1 bacterium]MDZ7339775.1 adenylyltransferase/cytidyltransferase family protein [candidate division KSB1 bacterium]
MNKVITFQQLLQLMQKARSTGNKIAWTNGCFDIIHVGHVDYLEKSKSYADLLIVGLNSDVSVKKLKGELRPIFSQADRARVLAAIEYVDHIIIFDEPSPIDYIRTLQPDFYIKGGDYTIDTIDQTERRAVEAYGGRIVLLPMVPGVSTSVVVEKIKQLSII